MEQHHPLFVCACRIHLAACAGLRHAMCSTMKALSTVLRARAADVSVKLQPAAFHESVVHGIRNAQKRISIATLYWGEGQREAQLVQHLRAALQASSQLDVSLVLDGSRARRWNNEPFAQLQKLAGEYKDRFSIGYFKVRVRVCSCRRRRVD